MSTAVMLCSSNTVYISSGAATDGERSKNMPKLLHARPPQDAAEEQKVRKLANSRHAPGDWIMRARMIARSWDGLRTTQIAEELGCATLRRCASASIASTRRDSTGLAIARAPAASHASAKPSAP